jgi:hypothetical protein
MSHFTALVVGDKVEEQLAPYHEFECTGHNDEYVQEIDKTEEAREQYEKHTTIMLRDKDGNLHEPYDDRFYREPTEEEAAKAGIGSGLTDGISYWSKDWGDGQGYRLKIKFIPEDMEEVEVHASEIRSFRDFTEGWFGWKPVTYGSSPDIDGDHKYGYVLLDKDGEVVKAVDRTNPNSKWDWYQVGGRWSGFFTLKSGKSGELGEKSWCNDGVEIRDNKADQAKKGDIDWDKMVSDNFEEYSKKYDEFEKLLKENPEEAKKKAYWNYGVENVGGDFKTDWKPEPREQYLKRAVPSTFAVVKDGKWYEKGNMGWWACVIDEKEQDKWNEEFKKLIEETDDDTLLTVVDCHI